MKNNGNNKKQSQKQQTFIIKDPMFVLWLKIMKPFLPKKIKIEKPFRYWRVTVL